MTYDIYFHDDFDGVAASAVMLNFLRSRGDDIKGYFPVTFDIEPKWPRLRFKRPAIIVDFLYHPRAAFWFDHHPTTFLKPEWRKRFRPTKFCRWNTRYFSCCHLMLDTLAKHFGYRPPGYLRELARWLDVIDGARYKSARQTIEKKEPALQLVYFLDARRKNPNILARFVRFLSTHSLRKAALLPEVKKFTKSAKGRTRKAVTFYKKNLVIEGRVAFIDISRARLVELRYAPFYLYPLLMYAVTLKKRARPFHLTVGANPWRREQSRIHIGELLRRCFRGAGGHRSVGGAEFKTRYKAEAAVRKLIPILSASGIR